MTASPEKGYFQMYTGNGKGKTTAALGLALRAAGAGRKVLFSQFLKTSTFSEHQALDRYSDHITVQCFGTGDFIVGEAKPEHHAAAQQGYATVYSCMKTGTCAVCICDEILAALHLGLLSKEQVLDLIVQRPTPCELIFTGRAAPEYLVEMADLVTEMVEVKHYFAKGVAARKGIEY